jgi:hypothetical protein
MMMYQNEYERGDSPLFWLLEPSSVEQSREPVPSYGILLYQRKAATEYHRR